MSVQQSYNEWSSVYDTNVNRTRDAEAIVIRELLSERKFDSCLEAGCGTGKNTGFLASICAKVKAVDFSEDMMAQGRQKNTQPNISYQQFDLLSPWVFDEFFDLVVFSLVLEHIQDLNSIFSEVKKVLRSGGVVYIGELHPYKQYVGSKARFDSENGTHELECYTHHLSDFAESAFNCGLSIEIIKEYFDEDGTPRILSMLLKNDLKR